MFVYGELQLSLGGADGLVDALHAHGSPLGAQDAAGRLFALKGAPPPLVRRLLHEVVRSDSRLCLVGDGDVGLADWAPPALTPLEDARFCVVDLETTGVGRGRASSRSARCGSSGSPASRRSSASSTRGCRCLRQSWRSRASRQRDLTGAGPVGPALRDLLRLAEGCVLVAHNARFDVGLPAACARRDRRAPPRAPGARHGVAGAAAALRPRGALRPRHARRSLLAPDTALPPCASRRPGDRRAPAAPDRVRAGAGGAHRRGRARPRRVGAARRAGPQAPRRAGAGRAGRVHPARRARAGDVRRQGGRSPLPGALVLRLAPAEAGARGGARSARPRRLRAARQRARGRARRARAHPRVAASGECPEHPSRAREVPAARRRGSRADARVARRSEERWRPVRRPVGVSSHGGDRARGLA